MRWLESIRYRRQVDDWVDDCTLLQDRIDRTRKALAGVYTFDGFRLDSGERLVAVQAVNLMETRRIRVTNYGSVSHHTSHHNAFRSGQSRSESHDELREVDHGRLIVTDRRLTYLGSKSREIPWRRLMQHTVGYGAAEFHATGQKTPLRVTYSRSSGPDFQYMVSLALAAFDGSETDFLRDRSNDLMLLRRNPPAVPAGVEADQRVAQFSLGAPAAPAALPPAPAASQAPATSPPPLPRGQFNSTELEMVAVSAARLGFATTVVRPPLAGAGEPRVVAAPAPEGSPSLGIELVVFACLPNQFAELANLLAPRWSVVVSPLAVEGIEVLDAPNGQPAIIRVDAGSFESLRESRINDGAAVTSLLKDSLNDPSITAHINTQLRLVRAMSKKAQVLVIDGSVEAETVVAILGGADEVVLVDNDIVEEVPEESVEAIQEPASLASAPPLTIAGLKLVSPATEVAKYLNDHPRTINRYDRTAGTYEAVTPELIAATRVLSSRISNDEAAWFIERASTAPWDLLPRDARLASADPCEVGGLYDRGSTLYAHFRAHVPKGVKAAKIYKVLHLMRPGFFPILDSRLARLYEAPAKAMAPIVNACRPDLPASKLAYWAAIRADLLAAADQITALRDAFEKSGDNYLAQALAAVSDLRILDMLGWQGDDDSDD